MDNNIIVLMTACISPEEGINNKPGNRLKRIDPLVRLEDYKKALKYWLLLPDKRIKE